MTDLDPHLLRQIYATDCKQTAGPAVLYDQLWIGPRSFGSSGPTAWNDMPARLCNSDVTLIDFRQLLKTALVWIASV